MGFMRMTAATLATALLAGCGSSSDGGGSAPTTPAKLDWPAYDRPAENAVINETDVPITMSDGTVLRANVARPDRDGRFPVLVELTPYNKNAPVAQGYTYLQERGYVQVTVDVRGTGSSQGVWDSFGPSEQQDGYEVVEWAAQQPWSDGKVGMIGPSYMGLTQILTAGLKPPHLKAIFPIVPMADAYRDITMSGGQVNTAFIPLWLGLVTGTSIVPPQYALDGDPADMVLAFTSLLQHVSGALNFQTSTVVNSIAGGDNVYDGPFWKTRSPMELDDQVDVPAFIVGGTHDLFQRGEPMHYERLRKRVTTKLLIGPWTHVDGSSGAGLPADGVPNFSHIALQWFDQYLKGMDVHADELPPVTYYTYGENAYRTQSDWPHPQLEPVRQYLHAGGVLDGNAPTGTEATDTWVQQPLSGICTQSSSQWTAGAAEPIPCSTDDRVNEAAEVTFTTAPMEQPLHVQGPMTARLWLSTSARDVVVAVRVTDVAPNGASQELTGGWLAGSFRAVDMAKSRVVRGELLQPWHPFTRESVLEVPADTPIELAVEVFPTNAVILPGHSLRIAVGPSDFPHAVPPTPQLVDTLGGVVTLLHDAGHPSYLALPVIGSRCAVSGTPGQCASLPVPDMVRH